MYGASNAVLYCTDSTLQRLRAVCAATARLLLYIARQSARLKGAPGKRKGGRVSKEGTWSGKARDREKGSGRGEGKGREVGEGRGGEKGNGMGG